MGAGVQEGGNMGGVGTVDDVCGALVPYFWFRMDAKASTQE